MKKNRWIWGILLVILSMFLLGSRKSIFLVLLILTVALPLISTLENKMAMRKLQIHLSYDPAGEKGQVVRGRLEVKNDSGFGLPHLQVRLCRENKLNRTDEEKDWILSIYPHRSCEEDISFVPADSGVIHTRIVKIQAWDIWGIFGVSLNPTQTAEVLIWPELYEQKIVLDAAEMQNPDAQEYAKEKPGNDPGEMFDIREYQPGDRLSSIHWKLSGKLDQLMVVRPGHPMENSILILFESNLDLLKRQNDKNQTNENQINKIAAARLQQARVDASISVFASICRGLLDEGICFHVGWMCETSEKPQICEITCEEDFVGMLPKVLASGYFGKENTIFERYLRLTGELAKAHCVCVSHCLPEVWNQLDTEPSVVTFLVSDGSDFEKLGEQIRKIGFAESGYEEQLYDLSI